LCYLSSYLFAYRGYLSAPLSVVAPIAYTAPAIATLLAVLFLGAKMTAIEGLPLVAIMVGVILLSTKFSDLRKSAGERGRSAVTYGVRTGLGASISFSFVFVALSAVVPLVGYLMPVLVLKAGGSLAGIALSPITRQDIRPSRKTLSLLVFGVAVLDTVGYLFLGAGLASAESSLPLVIMTSGMGGFFLVCYGILLRNEKPEPNQLVGILVSIVGVATLLYLTA
jgi:drug/metabolite transporter (DMT)-like permease